MIRIRPYKYLRSLVYYFVLIRVISVNLWLYLQLRVLTYSHFKKANNPRPVRLRVVAYVQLAGSSPTICLLNSINYLRLRATASVCGAVPARSLLIARSALDFDTSIPMLSAPVQA